jgi:hypothetical protein
MSTGSVIAALTDEMTRRNLGILLLASTTGHKPYLAERETYFTGLRDMLHNCIRYFTDNKVTNKAEYGHSYLSKDLNGLRSGHDA